MRLKIRGDKPGETPVELWLDQNGGEVYLKASRDGVSWNLLRIDAEQRCIVLYCCVSQGLGFQLDEKGSVKVV
jgi:hypothetical protein